MNILILNWRDPLNPSSGGAEVVTLEHASYWLQNGHTVDWFSMKYTNSRRQDYTRGIRIIRKGNMISVFFWAVLYYLFTKNKYDIVIDQLHGIPFFTPLYVHKAKKILFIHEVAGAIWSSMFSFPIDELGKFFEKIVLLLYRTIPIITVSKSTANELVSLGLRKEHITIIQNGVTASICKFIPPKNKYATFIFVSRLVKMKGIESVLQAFSYIKKEIPDAQLLIVGKGEGKYIRYLFQLAKKLNIQKNVQFHISVSDDEKIRLLRSAHILLHASVKEGWGLVVLEAAAQATPAVVYDVSGLRDSVKNNITGIIVDHNNSEELAKLAVRLYSQKEKYRIMQKNCLEWAKELTWEKSAKQSLHVIENL